MGNTPTVREVVCQYYGDNPYAHHNITDRTTQIYCTQNVSQLPIAIQNIAPRLWKLVCSATFLRELPELPINLRELYCASTFIQVLPRLPILLRVLDCRKSPIDILPELPTTLEYLFCSCTRIRSLPALPWRLKKLDCSYTQITELPDFRTLQFLEYVNAEGTNISEFPEHLPGMIIEMKLGYTKITNVPEIIIWPGTLRKIDLTGNNIMNISPLASRFLDMIQFYRNNEDCKVDRSKELEMNQAFRTMREKNEELMQKIEQLETHIKCMPEGSKYFEAMRHYKEMTKNFSA